MALFGSGLEIMMAICPPERATSCALLPGTIWMPPVASAKDPNSLEQFRMCFDRQDLVPKSGSGDKHQLASSVIQPVSRLVSEESSFDFSFDVDDALRRRLANAPSGFFRRGHVDASRTLPEEFVWDMPISGH